MKFTNLFLLAGALLSATSMFAEDWTQQIVKKLNKTVFKSPSEVPGPWQGTCFNSTLSGNNGNTLTATCWTSSSSWRRPWQSSVDLTFMSPQDSVENVGGRLTLKKK